jgi:predicted RNase H-like nuclease (RuvC/YqgF family)
MTDVAAPSSWFLDFQIPSVLCRWDGRVRPTPVRVPELALVPGPRQRNDVSSFDREWVDHSSVNDAESLRIELVILESQVPRMRQERDELRMELTDLNDQIPTLRRERDELLAAAVPLSAEVTALQSKQEELIPLRSEIQALRLRKSSLERSLAELRRPSETSRRGWTGHQRFHDS